MEEEKQSREKSIARREYDNHEAWWRNAEPRSPLPPDLETLLEKEDPQFLDEMKKFALAFTVSLYVWNQEQQRHEKHELYSVKNKDDGSWLWTLYTKKEPLARQALKQLIGLVDRQELDDLIQSWRSTFQGYSWLHGGYQLYYEGNVSFIPFTETFYRYVKGIYKLAEQRRDAEIWGVLAHRFDADKRFHHWMELEEHLSRTIYSSKTHHYLRRRSWRTLRQLGEEGNAADYVAMATAALLSYTDRDGRIRWLNVANSTTPVRHTDFTHLWLFNHLLHRNSSRYSYHGNQTWKFHGRPGEIVLEREEAYPHLWDQHPSALWRLFQEGKAGPVIWFAARALGLAHREYLRQHRNELKALLQSDRKTHLAGAAWMLLQLSTHPDLDTPDLDCWLRCSFHQEASVREIAFAFIGYHQDRWTTSQIRHLFQRFIHVVQDTELDAAVMTDWIEGIRRYFTAAIPQVVSLDLIKEMASRNHPLLNEFSAILLQYIDWDNQPMTGQDLLPFLQNEHPPLRQTARRVLLSRFTQLQLEAAFLADFASIPGEDHQVFATQFFADRMLWLVPHLPELIRRLWSRMLQSDQPEEVRAYIREDLLGGLFFEEMAQTPLEKVLHLLHHHQTEYQELGARLLQLIQPQPKDLTQQQLVRLAHSPVALAREEARRLLLRQINEVPDELLVHLAETEWDDTRNWTLAYLETRSSAEITPDLIYGLLDTARADIQTFAMKLIRIHEKRLEPTELLVRAGQHPDLRVQEFALELAQQVEWTPELLNKMELFFRTVLFRVHGGRKAKNMALALLTRLGETSPELAKGVVSILSDVARNIGTRDFERILAALTRIQMWYPDISTPLAVH
ncbi:hypothetical protein JQC72_08470 [Polycladomyces sp. WAk]|uniref:Uncharacterized protein n=1 Tax=Polycladomyces zharkentensis TaxID=2807616 RepID=A0ABS2WJA9_9BACL|nr:hypothetical protein [Polycladomyces sp. WAk]MBN2909560.1 hypothetical protein [Polycladomyces sp. WAk]